MKDLEKKLFYLFNLSLKEIGNFEKAIKK